MRLTVAVLLSLTVGLTTASYCGKTGVPYSFEVLPSGAPVLGCAQPSCVAAAEEPLVEDSEFLTDVNGQSDGFFREGDRTLKRYRHQGAPKLVANCTGSFNELSCPRKNQFVGGIEYIDHPRQPLILQCCTYDALKFSQEVGTTNVGPGEAITGGEVVRNGRQISFDVIANVRKIVKSSGSQKVSYEVTVRRMNCLPDPPEPEVEFENEVPNEVLKVLAGSGTPAEKNQKKKEGKHKKNKQNAAPTEQIDNAVNSEASLAPQHQPQQVPTPDTQAQQPQQQQQQPQVQQQQQQQPQQQQQQQAVDPAQQQQAQIEYQRAQEEYQRKLAEYNQQVAQQQASATQAPPAVSTLFPTLPTHTFPTFPTLPPHTFPTFAPFTFPGFSAITPAPAAAPVPAAQPAFGGFQAPVQPAPAFATPTGGRAFAAPTVTGADAQAVGTGVDASQAAGQAAGQAVSQAGQTAEQAAGQAGQAAGQVANQVSQVAPQQPPSLPSLPSLPGAGVTPAPFPGFSPLPGLGGAGAGGLPTLPTFPPPAGFPTAPPAIPQQLPIGVSDPSRAVAMGTILNQFQGGYKPIEVPGLGVIGYGTNP
ncbi:unnamed protein product [Bursaphelenchus xylophilus]|uniref:(pine wood nematode) hypothetical protein n=1 Tax=Bursaphelenchus xylophilus TaxID=6326 RepID=A0A1I7RK78_BURXY|nr:unnamed protein product [Bursaphelenchus xylophilus]CAG9131441.1 unnamed protein product [Bursaphelenchus xylophilus]